MLCMDFQKGLKNLVASVKYVVFELTRLNMLFIPMLPLKADFIAILSILSNAKNAEET